MPLLTDPWTARLALPQTWRGLSALFCSRLNTLWPQLPSYPHWCLGPQGHFCRHVCIKHSCSLSLGQFLGMQPSSTCTTWPNQSMHLFFSRVYMYILGIPALSRMVLVTLSCQVIQKLMVVSLSGFDILGIPALSRMVLVTLSCQVIQKLIVVSLSGFDIQGIPALSRMALVILSWKYSVSILGRASGKYQGFSTHCHTGGS